MNRKRSSLAANLNALDERISPQIDAVTRPEARKVAPSRVGKKHLLVPIDPAVHKRLKHLAVDREMSIESMVRTAIDRLLASEDS